MSILGPDSLLAASITVEVAWPTDPGSGDAPTWTDITPWVRSLTISRGRQYELDRVEAGTLTAELINSDGRFDPTNTSSPYYPYVLPLRQVRVRSFYDGLEYPLFWGYAERWPMRWESIVSGRTELSASDGFAVLAQRTLRAAVIEELTTDLPLALYPFDDPVGSTTAANLDASGGTAPARIVQSKYGSGSVVFGAEAITADGIQTTAYITEGDGSTTASAGAALELTNPTNGGPWISAAAGFSVECWFKCATIGASEIWTLFHQSNTTTTSPLISLRLVNAGSLQFSVGNGTPGGEVAFISTFGTLPALDDGEPHHVVGVLQATGTIADLYVDGELVASDTLSGPAFTSTTGYMQVGGHRTPLQSVEFAGDLQVALLAMWNSDISGLVADHYAAGADGFLGERTDQRIARALVYAGWQGGSDLDTGKSTMSAASVAGSTALAMIQEAVEAEDGNAYIDGNNQLVFKNRHARYNQATVATFGDPPGVGELHYAPDSEFDYDWTRIFSRVTVSPPATAKATREDATALERYLERTLEESPAIDTAEEAVDRANYRLARYKDPHLRMPALTVLPQRGAASWPAVLGLEFGDPVEVTRDPSGAPAITSMVLIESVEHQVTSELWVATFALSPADINTYWILEDPVLGLIDDEPLVAY